jgi:D-sedoheptulose 7-phosphate isomerase
MAPLCDYNVIIPSSVTQHIQECHLALEHIFCMIVERCYFGPEIFEPRLAKAHRS